MFALLLFTMFIVHSTVGKVGAAVLLVLAVPLLVKKLNNKAARDRDHMHPSR
jgi:ABC-type methionine transport system permease subunit